MVSIVLLFTFVYLVVIILTDDPRTTFPRLAEKLTPEQEVFIERLRQWIDYLRLGAFLLLLYAAWILWLAYKFRVRPADPP
jgi:hypothetical protein